MFAVSGSMLENKTDLELARAAETLREVIESELDTQYDTKNLALIQAEQRRRAELCRFVTRGTEAELIQFRQRYETEVPDTGNAPAEVEVLRDYLLFLGSAKKLDRARLLELAAQIVATAERLG